MDERDSQCLDSSRLLEPRLRRPKWLRDSELAQECLDGIEGRKFVFPEAFIVERLTWMIRLEKGASVQRAAVAKMKRDVMRMAKGLNRTIGHASLLLRSPAAVLDTKAAQRLSAGLMECAHSLAAFKVIATGPPLRDQLRADITLELRTYKKGGGGYNDQAVGELVGIAAEAAKPPTERIRPDTLTPRAQAAWRARAAAAQKQWRLRHKKLLEQFEKRRSEGMMKALRDIGENLTEEELVETDEFFRRPARE